jgi:hypothetical protein
LNLLDESFPKDQLPLLKKWHIPFRRFGQDIARLGVKDPDILPLLHQLRRATFFTLDELRGQLMVLSYYNTIN